jgi:putative transposase
MNKAYKFRLYPNAEQAVIFAKTFGCVRFIYNKMLGDKITHYNETKEKLNNTPAQYKSDFEWLKEVDSLALANAQLNLQTAYNNFFKKPNVGFPKFKSKRKNHNSYTTNNQNGSVRIENGCLKLPKIGFVKMKQHRIIPEHYTLKSVTVSKTPSGKYYASILFEYEQIVEPVEIKNVIGLDFSMSELFVDSNGNEANYPRYYRRKLDKLKKMSRTLAKMVKFSNNWHKQKHKIAVLHETIANQRKDFLHKQSRQIANAYDLVGVEDLNMKAMSQALNFGKSVADNSWGMFRTFLKYKLEEQGKYFIAVDKFFPSSRKCSTQGCTYVYKNLTIDIRKWVCPECAVNHDRDINAAINIRNEAVRLITA